MRILCLSKRLIGVGVRPTTLHKRLPNVPVEAFGAVECYVAGLASHVDIRLAVVEEHNSRSMQDLPLGVDLAHQVADVLVLPLRLHAVLVRLECLNP